MRMKIWFCTALATLVFPSHVWAQDEPLAQTLVDMLVRAVSMPSTTQTVAGNPHEAHFLPSLAQTQAPFEINKALVAQLGTFPIGTSSGGFTFTFNRNTGIFTPASKSFGPAFAERALTNGRGRFSVGMNYQRLEFGKFEGIDLHNTNPSNNITFVLQHNDCCPGQTATGAPVGNGDPKNPAFEGDLVETSLSLHLKTDVVSAFASYGLTHRWDVGVVVPIVRVQISPTLTSTIDRLSTSANPLIHSFDGNGLSTETVSESQSATGLGDLAIRTKYRLVDTQGGGLAAGLDLRLPTGDKENLLGTGAVQTKISVIASGEYSHVAPHANIGYTFSHGEVSSSVTNLEIPSTGLPGSSTPYTTIFPSGVPVSTIVKTLPNEFTYTGGVDIAVHPLLTVSADLIGRALLDVKRFGVVSQSFNYRTVNDGPLSTASRNAFALTNTGTLNLLLGVIGAKFNIPNTPLLITGSVLFPLTDSGLRPNVTPVIGLDYSIKKKK